MPHGPQKAELVTQKCKGYFLITDSGCGQLFLLGRNHGCGQLLGFASCSFRHPNKIPGEGSDLLAWVRHQLAGEGPSCREWREGSFQKRNIPEGSTGARPTK